MTSFIVYKTTNVLNNIFYIGLHKTTQLDFDGYYGSGLHLKRAIKKHGKENFNRETLFTFDTLAEARAKEKEIVTTEFTKSNDNYNISVGGTGGNTTAGFTDVEMIEYKNNLKISKKKRKIFLDENNLNYFTEETLVAMSISAVKRVKEKPHTIPNNKNRVHYGQGLENIKMAAENRKGKWICINDGINTVVQLKENPIPEGFTLGYGPDRPRLKSHSEETKKSMSENSAIRGTTVYNNGIICVRLHPSEEIPAGYVKGFLIKSTIKYIWINNDDVILRVNSEDPIPAGFIRGRTLKSKKFIMINNGIHAIKHQEDLPIPIGYTRGRKLIKENTI